VPLQIFDYTLFLPLLLLLLLPSSSPYQPLRVWRKAPKALSVDVVADQLRLRAAAAAAAAAAVEKFDQYVARVARHSAASDRPP